MGLNCTGFVCLLQSWKTQQKKKLFKCNEIFSLILFISLAKTMTQWCMYGLNVTHDYTLGHQPTETSSAHWSVWISEVTGYWSHHCVSGGIVLSRWCENIHPQSWAVLRIRWPHSKNRTTTSYANIIWKRRLYS